MSRRKNQREIIEIDSTASVSTQPREHRYVAVAGTIGSGKSSIVDFLAQKYGLVPFFEPNEGNPYLEDFYGDMKAWAFHSQIYFLSAKFQLHQELDQLTHSVVQDRTIWEDAEIFAENLYRQKIMSERDYRTYRLLYESVQHQVRPPDLMLYMRCPVTTVKKRIAQRGRQMERDIPTAYLKRLHALYDSWIENYTLSPVVIIPTNKLDYMTDLVDQHDILTTIEKYL
jgi:deoxyadenosine/deoxycytidine kinase